MTSGRIRTVVAFAGLLAGAGPLWAEEPPLRQVIDAEVRAGWERQKLTPAALADDATFLRRIWLDLCGTIPTAEEARRFLSDRDPRKREKLIDRLLADPRFAAHQADAWHLVLFGRNPPNLDYFDKREGFKTWLTAKWSANVPYDRWVRDLLLAEQEGTQVFHAQFRNRPDEEAVAVSRIFLGTQLQCARCHDHPFESWTQRDFYGFAAFFARLVVLDAAPVKGTRRFTVAEKSSGELLFSGSAKEQKPGRKGEAVAARFLGGAVVKEPPLPKGFKEPVFRAGKPLPRPRFSRKEKLAAWLATADNPYFARAVANRVWAQFMGRGIVHPVDDLGGKRLPTHPALLKALTDHLVAHRFDLKDFIREIVNSRAYQQAATGANTEAAPYWYDRARVRPLTLEELIAVFRVSTGFDASAPPGKATLPGAMEAYMRQYFGEPTDGRGIFQPGLSEHLFLNNSDQLRAMIRPRKGNLADGLLRGKGSWEERVERLFLAVLTRLPRAEERKRFVTHLTSAKKAEPLVEEAIWALLNCSEFRLNH